jgi:predicted secreted protein
MQTVTVGNTFQIERPMLRSAGYSLFNVKTTPGLSVVHEDYIVDHPGRIGSGGKKIWTLKATEPGTHLFSVIYGRPWDETTWTNHAQEFKAE